jgi:hypothetical protein
VFFGVGEGPATVKGTGGSALFVEDTVRSAIPVEDDTGVACGRGNWRTGISVRFRSLSIFGVEYLNSPFWGLATVKPI